MWKGLQDSNCPIQIVCDTSSRVYFQLKSFPSQVIFTGAIEHDWRNPVLHPCMGLHNLWNLKAFNSALYTIFMLSKVTALLQVVTYFSGQYKSIEACMRSHFCWFPESRYS
jgi:hypothetical protein